MDFSALRAELKKGDPERLAGRLVAYVRYQRPPDNPPGPGDTETSPLEALVRNGILAVTANYVEQRDIRDFFRKEFGISLEKGIEEVIEQARETGGLEGALDPEAVKERLDSMKNAEFIPIPAKVAYFGSEQEMLAQDADVYYLGAFTMLAHAHLCVNAFPLLYQAHYREQEHKAVEGEIAALLGAIESSPGSADEREPKALPADWKSHLLTVLIPRMIYTRGEAGRPGEAGDHARSVTEFRDFMDDFGYPADTEAMVSLIEAAPSIDAPTLRKLELLVSKVEALQSEDYERLESIKRELAALG
jgi:hypothetical protein